MDFIGDGIVAKRAGKIGLIDVRKNLKKAAKLDEDADMLYKYIVLPRAVAEHRNIHNVGVRHTGGRFFFGTGTRTAEQRLRKVSSFLLIHRK